MKNIIKIIIPLSVICISSCKQSTESKLVYKNNQTVKEIIKNKNNEITWTKALDEDLLERSNNTSDRINSEFSSLSIDTVKIISDYNNPEYPELSDFGSLDISKLNASVRKMINDFCTDVSEDIYSGVDKYFNTSYRFNYVFFRNTIIDQWEKEFDSQFPLSEKEAAKIKEIKRENERRINRKKEKETRLNELNERIKEKNQTETVSSENNGEISDSQILKSNQETIESIEAEYKKDKFELEYYEQISIFDKWILGEPFITKEMMQIPVRLYCQPGTIDITLYINLQKQNSIYQITVDKWRKI